jgi:thiol-disulfide isomerase/thioredoxin
MKDNRTTLVLVALLVVASFAVGSMYTRNKFTEDQKIAAEAEKARLAEQQAQQKVLGEEAAKQSGLGNLMILEGEACQEDGKPLVYYFGYSGCPHCKWEHPVFEKVVKDFSGLIALHDNMDKLENDREAQQKYSGISGNMVPFMLFGCKYAQLGSGESWGEVEETKNLQAVLCKLTEGKPEGVCGKVTDYIGKISE